MPRVSGLSCNFGCVSWRGPDQASLNWCVGLLRLLWSSNSIAWAVKLMPEVCTSSMQAEYETYVPVGTILVYDVNCLMEIGLPISLIGSRSSQLRRQLGRQLWIRPIASGPSLLSSRSTSSPPVHRWNNDDKDKAFIAMERLPRQFMITDIQTKITPRSVHEPVALQICGYGKLSSAETRALTFRR